MTGELSGSSTSESTEESSEEYVSSVPIPKKQKKSIYTPRLLAALDKCAVSNRNAIHLISAVIDAIGDSTDDYDLSKSGIAIYRRANRKKVALEKLKSYNVNDFLKLLLSFLA